MHPYNAVFVANCVHSHVFPEFVEVPSSSEKAASTNLVPSAEEATRGENWMFGATVEVHEEPELAET
jgi:hypothetical protein